MKFAERILRNLESLFMSIYMIKKMKFLSLLLLISNLREM